MVGFTAKTSRMSRDSMMGMLQTHDELIRPIIESFEGRIVKTLGDAFMSTFDSPTNAVLCAVKIQSVLTAHNEPLPENNQIHVRCALNAGEVQVTEDEDIFGEAVNVSSDDAPCVFDFVSHCIAPWFSTEDADLPTAV